MASSTTVIFRKEIEDAMRSRSVLLLIAGLSAVAILSVIVAAAAFRAKVADYNTYLIELQQAGIADVPPPQFFPLQLLRGAVEYLEIIGAIVAIVIGYGLAAKEKNRGTLGLIFSRPVSGLSLASGKLLALAAIWLAVVGALGLVLLASIGIVGGTLLAPIELMKLTITAGLAWIYLFMWSALAFGLTNYVKQLSTALIAGLMLWLVFVLIIPQIGDTMDPDNQVPGGLFKSLQIVDKAQEKAVLAHFSGYETTRDLLEETSISKQFERSAFAYLGQKEQYNQKSLAYISRDMWMKIMWLVLGMGIAVGLAVTQTTKRNLMRKGTA